MSDQRISPEERKALAQLTPDEPLDAYQLPSGFRLDGTDRAERTGNLVANIFIVIAVIAGVIWASDDLQQWLANRLPPPLVAERQAVTTIVECRPPTEHEQLHIVVIERDGKLVAECMQVGTRGTYKRRGQ